MNGLHGIIFSYEQEPGLRELAERRMPASIPFGGRYRVVDFMLSNLHAAGITDVGVVLHGNYQSLLDHIGNGKTWDMARKYGGLRILPPFADTRAYRSGEFRGKMEALAGVRSYLQGIRQDYVVLSDSDLIINLPLADVFAAHLESGADITAVCTANGGFVDNATYLTLESDGAIGQVWCAPTAPRGHRSLEIYILSKQLLLTLVDECSAQDKYSFRRDVLAGMTGRLKLQSYVWDGYAAQLRSVQEYYDRSMELLQGSIRAELFAAARPILAKEDDEAVREEFYKSVRTVITVHNIEYQGRYGRETVEDLFGLDVGWFTGGTLAFDGDVNLLKGAIVTADAVTAVSPTYAQELKYAYFAHGLESVMQMVEGKLHGVLNGIDMERYDPASDPNLTANYSLRRMAGKAKDKAALQRMMGLAERKDTPVVAMVSRLVSHKGLDLVCETLDYFMEKDMQLVVLGKGDGKYESFFSWAQAKYPGRVAVHLGYSESLAMQIYAGADLFLMPSKSEPCGLSQMIAMRYGAVPIVRETGGLKDTVHAYEAWNGAGNGFSFTNYNAGDMCYVIGEAVDLYHQKPEAYKALRKRGMAEDFSWARSAKKYREIYDSICK